MRCSGQPIANAQGISPFRLLRCTSLRNDGYDVCVEASHRLKAFPQECGKALLYFKPSFEY